MIDDFSNLSGRINLSQVNLFYDAHSDPIIQALIDEARTDPDVIGLVLLGSRSTGVVTPESDYDVMFAVTDEAKKMEVRAEGIQFPNSRNDIWDAVLSDLQIEKVETWMLPAYADAIILYDRTGETTRCLEALRRVPVEQVKGRVEYYHDAYLNGMFRSLKSWRRGNELGGRLEATESVDYLMYLLFALEGRWRPYSSRLWLHLSALDGQGWQPGELHRILLDLIKTGDPRLQQLVARRVVAILGQHGYGYMYDGWDGQIDLALAWDFDE
jgi:hypothetical protein